jgi:hypothetical protein
MKVKVRSLDKIDTKLWPHWTEDMDKYCDTIIDVKELESAMCDLYADDTKYYFRGEWLIFLEDEKEEIGLPTPKNIPPMPEIKSPMFEKEEKEKEMKVEIQLLETSQPIVYKNVLNTYTKGIMYCVLVEKDGKRKVHKYPAQSIFRVIESY